MTFDTKMLGAALLVVLSGCDRGSVGEFESDDGSASSGASSSGAGSTDSAATGSSSAETGNATETATSTSTSGETETGESSGTSTSSGGVVAACEGNENHQCSSPIDCGESCGELDSMFDAFGCVRQACGTHADCDDGMFCYRPMDYGGCQSSDVGCTEDLDGNCVCASLPDCGGAYCVAEDIVFGGATPGPSDGWASNECGPDDGPAFVVRVGTYISDACGGQFAEEPLLEFHVGRNIGTTGTFSTGGADFIAATYYPDGVTPEPAQWAVLFVAQADGVLSGEYAVTLQDDTVLYGSYAAISCPDEMLICG